MSRGRAVKWPVLFADGEPSAMSEGWALIHPELRSLLVDLDHWSQAQRIRRPVITDLVRSRRKQRAIYVALWTDATTQLVTKGVIDNGTAERIRQMRNEAVKLLVKQRALPDAVPLILSGVAIGTDSRIKVAHLLRPETLENEAEKRFTWHWVGCGADLRTRHYGPSEKSRVFAYLEAKAKPRHRFELLEHDTAGPHIHLAVKDEAWRAQWEAKHV